MVEKNLHYFNAETFVESTIKLIVEKFQLIISSKQKVNIALSGGTTPIPILKELAKYDLNWSQFNFFLVDERCVPINERESNFGNINKVFFSKIKANSFSVVKENKTYEECSIAYENLIKEKVEITKNGFPIFDLIFLGMGTDGHTASLFPETKGLNEKNKIVFLNKVPQLNTSRITFSYPLLFNAKEIIVLVSGEGKDEIIKEIYSNSSNKYPISVIAYQHKNLKWYISK
ncbi:6-phosphogluconolactonase [Polaribacter septentrionalilitoris]|uniref:6-phosphogluconolactonase n=1 Tax=Polaribacter septentrionalilitoris TaxID=2494657 RepID=UPI00135783E2|nr:6-phosphogluconolactonase [Polaribacter septentrionalilitoris]